MRRTFFKKRIFAENFFPKSSLWKDKNLCCIESNKNCSFWQFWNIISIFRWLRPENFVIRNVLKNSILLLHFSTSLPVESHYKVSRKFLAECPLHIQIQRANCGRHLAKNWILRRAFDQKFSRGHFAKGGSCSPLATPLGKWHAKNSKSLF